MMMHGLQEYRQSNVCAEMANSHYFHVVALCRYSHPFNKESILEAWRSRSGEKLRALNFRLRKLGLPTALEVPRASDEWASAVECVSRLVPDDDDSDDDDSLDQAWRFCSSLRKYYGKQPEFAHLEGKFRPAWQKQGQKTATKMSEAVEIPEALLVKSRIHDVMFSVAEETKVQAFESLVRLCVNTKASSSEQND